MELDQQHCDQVYHGGDPNVVHNLLILSGRVKPSPVYSKQTETVNILKDDSMVPELSS